MPQSENLTTSPAMQKEMEDAHMNRQNDLPFSHPATSGDIDKLANAIQGNPEKPPRARDLPSGGETKPNQGAAPPTGYGDGTVRPPGVPSTWVWNGSFWYNPSGDGQANTDGAGNVTIVNPDGTFTWIDPDGNSNTYPTSLDMQIARNDWAIANLYGGKLPPWAGPEFPHSKTDGKVQTSTATVTSTGSSVKVEYAPQPTSRIDSWIGERKQAHKSGKQNQTLFIKDNDVVTGMS